MLTTRHVRSVSCSVNAGLCLEVKVQNCTKLYMAIIAFLSRSESEFKYKIILMSTSTDKSAKV